MEVNLKKSIFRTKDESWIFMKSYTKHHGGSEDLEVRDLVCIFKLCIYISLGGKSG